jgi:hypothetical protein
MRLGFLLAGLAILSSAALAQTAPKLNEKALRAALEDRLKDADSAKFRALKYLASESPGSWAMCGEVNAKNSYGGYSGFEPFRALAFKDLGQPVQYFLIGIGEAAGNVCASDGLRP